MNKNTKEKKSFKKIIYPLGFGSLATPLIAISAISSNSSTSNANNKSIFVQNAKIGNMKIWNMVSSSRGYKLKNNYEGVIVSLGTNINDNDIKNILKNKAGALISWDKTYDGSKAGIYTATITQGSKKSTLKIFVTDNEFNFPKAFQNKTLPHGFLFPSNVTSFWDPGSSDGMFLSTKLNDDFEIPSTFTKIPSKAFQLTTLNDDFEIPSSVTEIGNYAFIAGTLNEGFKIPNSVTNIGKRSFDSIGKLPESFKLSNNLKKIKDNLFANSILNDNFEIPSSVKEIWLNAFENSTLNDSFEIPSSVEIIDRDVFKDATLNVSFKIPTSVKEIKQYAFRDATLNQIKIDDSTIGTNNPKRTNDVFDKIRLIDTILEKFANDTNKGNIFFNTKVGTKLTKEDLFKLIKNYYKDTTKFDKVYIDQYIENIQYINDDLHIDFKDVVKNGKNVVIKGSAFKHTSFVQNTKIGNMEIWNMVSDNAGKKLKNNYEGVIVSLGTNINDNDIKNTLKNKAGALISWDKTYDGSKAGIYTATITQGSKKSTLKIFVTNKEFNFSSAFQNKTLPHGFLFPSNVTSFGNPGSSNGMFYHTKLNDDFEIPSTFTRIARSAFEGTTLNDSFVIPESVTSIGTWGFLSSILNEGFKVPNTVGKIGQYVFKDATLNDSFKIPSSVTDIPWNALDNATLNQIKIDGSAIGTNNVKQANDTFDKIRLIDTILEKFTNDTNKGNIFSTTIIGTKLTKEDLFKLIKNYYKDTTKLDKVYIDQYIEKIQYINGDLHIDFKDVVKNGKSVVIKGSAFKHTDSDDVAMLSAWFDNNVNNKDSKLKNASTTLVKEVFEKTVSPSSIGFTDPFSVSDWNGVKVSYSKQSGGDGYMLSLKIIISKGNDSETKYVIVNGFQRKSDRDQEVADITKVKTLFNNFINNGTNTTLSNASKTLASEAFHNNNTVSESAFGFVDPSAGKLNGATIIFQPYSFDLKNGEITMEVVIKKGGAEEKFQFALKGFQTPNERDVDRDVAKVKDLFDDLKNKVGGTTTILTNASTTLPSDLINNSTSSGIGFSDPSVGKLNGETVKFSTQNVDDINGTLEVKATIMKKKSREEVIFTLKGYETKQHRDIADIAKVKTLFGDLVKNGATTTLSNASTTLASEAFHNNNTVSESAFGFVDPSAGKLNDATVDFSTYSFDGENGEITMEVVIKKGNAKEKFQFTLKGFQTNDERKKDIADAKTNATKVIDAIKLKNISSLNQIKNLSLGEILKDNYKDYNNLPDEQLRNVLDKATLIEEDNIKIKVITWDDIPDKNSSNYNLDYTTNANYGMSGSDNYLIDVEIDGRHKYYLYVTTLSTKNFEELKNFWFSSKANRIIPHWETPDIDRKSIDSWDDKDYIYKNNRYSWKEDLILSNEQDSFDDSKTNAHKAIADAKTKEDITNVLPTLISKVKSARDNLDTAITAGDLVDAKLNAEDMIDTIKLKNISHPKQKEFSLKELLQVDENMNSDHKIYNYYNYLSPDQLRNVFDKATLFEKDNIKIKVIDWDDFPDKNSGIYNLSIPPVDYGMSGVFHYLIDVEIDGKHKYYSYLSTLSAGNFEELKNFYYSSEVNQSNSTWNTQDTDHKSPDSWGDKDYIYKNNRYFWKEDLILSNEQVSFDNSKKDAHKAIADAKTKEDITNVLPGLISKVKSARDALDIVHANEAISKDKALFASSFNQTVNGKPNPISDGPQTATTLSGLSGHSVMPVLTTGVARTFNTTTDTKTGIATVTITFSSLKGTDQSTTYTISGFKNADESAVDGVVALFDDLKNKIGGTTTILTNASTTLPSDLTNNSTSSGIGFSDPSAGKLNGATVTFLIQNIKDDNGTLEVKANVTKGKAKEEVIFTLKGHETKQHRDIADVAKVKTLFDNLVKNGVTTTLSNASTTLASEAFNNNNTVSESAFGFVDPSAGKLNDATVDFSTYSFDDQNGEIMMEVVIKKGNAKEKVRFTLRGLQKIDDRNIADVAKVKALFDDLVKNGATTTLSNASTTLASEAFNNNNTVSESAFGFVDPSAGKLNDATVDFSTYSFNDKNGEITMEVVIEKGNIIEKVRFTLRGLQITDDRNIADVAKVKALFDDLVKNGATTTLSNGSETLPSDIHGAANASRVGFNDPSAGKLNDATITFLTQNKEDIDGTWDVKAIITKGAKKDQVLFTIRGFKTTIQVDQAIIDGIVASNLKLPIGTINKLPKTENKPGDKTINGANVTFDTWTQNDSNGTIAWSVTISKGTGTTLKKLSGTISGFQTTAQRNAADVDDVITLFDGYVKNGVTTNLPNAKDDFPNISENNPTKIGFIDPSINKRNGTTIAFSAQSPKNSSGTLEVKVVVTKGKSNKEILFTLKGFQTLYDYKQKVVDSIGVSDLNLPTGTINKLPSTENKPGDTTVKNTNITFDTWTQNDADGTIAWSVTVGDSVNNNQLNGTISGFQTTAQRNAANATDVSGVIALFNDYVTNGVTTTLSKSKEIIPNNNKSNPFDIGLTDPSINKRNGTTIAFLTQNSDTVNGTSDVKVIVTKGNAKEEIIFKLKGFWTTGDAEQKVVDSIGVSDLNLPTGTTNKLPSTENKPGDTTVKNTNITFDTWTQNDADGTIAWSVTVGNSNLSTPKKLSGTINGYETIAQRDAADVSRVIALFNDLKKQSGGTATGLNNASTTLPSDLKSASSATTIGFTDPSLSNLNGTKITFSTQNINDVDGTLDVKVVVRKGSSTNQVVFALKGYEKTDERDAADVSGVIALFDDLKKQSGGTATILHNASITLPSNLANTSSAAAIGFTDPSISDLSGAKITFSTQNINDVDGTLDVKVAVTKGSSTNQVVFALKGYETTVQALATSDQQIIDGIRSNNLELPIGDQNRLPSTETKPVDKTVNSTNVTFNSWTPNDTNGTIAWSATVSKGSGTNPKQLSGTISDFQTIAQRDAADVVVAKNAIIAINGINKNTSSNILAVSTPALFDNTVLASLGKGATFPTIPSGVALKYTHPIINKDGTFVITVNITKGNAQSTATFNFIVSGIDAKKANDAIGNDQALFAQFNQTITGKPKAIKDGEINKKVLTTLNGHTQIPTITSGVKRTFTIATDNKTGVATVTVAITSPKGKSQNATYTISGFKTEDETDVDNVIALFDDLKNQRGGTATGLNNASTTLPSDLKSASSATKIGFTDPSLSNLSGAKITFSTQNINDVDGTLDVKVAVTKGSSTNQVVFALKGYETIDERDTADVNGVIALFDDLKNQRGGTATGLNNASTTLPSDLKSASSATKIGFTDPSLSNLNGAKIAFSTNGINDANGTLEVKVLVTKGSSINQVVFTLKGYETIDERDTADVAHVIALFDDLKKQSGGTATGLNNASTTLPSDLKSVYTAKDMGFTDPSLSNLNGAKIEFSTNGINDANGTLEVKVLVTKNRKQDTVLFTLKGYKTTTQVDQAIIDGIVASNLKLPIGTINKLPKTENKPGDKTINGANVTFDTWTQNDSNGTISWSATVSKGAGTNSKQLSGTISGFQTTAQKDTADVLNAKKAITAIKSVIKNTSSNISAVSTPALFDKSVLASLGKGVTLPTIPSGVALKYTHPIINKDGTFVITVNITKGNAQSTATFNVIVSGIDIAKANDAIKKDKALFMRHNEKLNGKPKPIKDGITNRNTLINLNGHGTIPIPANGVKRTFTIATNNKTGIAIVTVNIVSPKGTPQIITYTISGFKTEDETDVDNVIALFNNLKSKIGGTTTKLSSNSNTLPSTLKSANTAKGIGFTDPSLSNLNGAKILFSVENEDDVWGTLEVKVVVTKGSSINQVVFALKGYETTTQVNQAIIKGVTIADLKLPIGDHNKLPSIENKPGDEIVNGARVRFRSWTQKDANGSIHWIATVSKGTGTTPKQLHGFISGFQTTDERDTADVAVAKKAITDIKSVNKNVSSKIVPIASATPFNSQALASLGSGKKFPTIPNGVTLTYTHLGINKDGTLIVNVVITKGNATDHATFDIAVSGIDAANQAKLTSGLVQAQKTAKSVINSIKSLKTLISGATLTGSEQTDFTTAIATAKQAINNAKTPSDVTNAQTVGTRNITAAKNALDQAISAANQAKLAADLAQAQTRANNAIDSIKSLKNLVNGATLTGSEQSDFTKAIIVAKNAIINAKKVVDVTKAQTIGTTNVTTAKNALDQAIGAANQAKLSADLAQAQTRANNAINSIKSLKTLISGATLTGSEQTDFTTAIATAKQAINNAKTFVDITRSHSKGVVDVTIARNALDSAIKNANLQVVATLAPNQVSAFKAIDNIKPQSTLISGAIAPAVEQQGFIQAITTAKNAIMNVTTIVDVTNAQTVGTTNVTAARNALDQAIGAANQAKLAADLVQARTRANNAIDSIKSLKNLIKGAKLNGSEKSDFTKAIKNAKQAIKNATTVAGVTTAHSKGVTDVTIARNALDTAIKNANLNVVANLTTGQVSAFNAIDNIKPQSTLISGAIAPAIEQQNFVQAITTAKNAIMNATTIVDFTNAQKVGIISVTVVRNVLDQAINAANQAKLAADLAQAQIRANSVIDSIKSLKNLIKDAKLNGSEQKDFNTTIATATKAINDAKTFVDVTKSNSKGVADVTSTRNALDTAIKKANLNVVANLTPNQVSAFNAIDNIKPQSTLIIGAIAPAIEQQDFVQAITTAKNAIMNVKATSDITNAQKVGTTNVTAARNAFDQAIDAANQAKLAADLVQARTRANNAIDSIKSLKNLVNGATLTGSEQSDFTKAIANAKQAIKNATTVAGVTTAHSKGVADVTSTRNALDTAIKKANLNVVANLTTDQVSAFNAIDNIKPQSTLISGAIAPAVEQQGFIQAITTAKNAIMNAKTTSGVTNAQTVGTTNVTAAKDALDQAISAANQAKLVADLVQAQIRANNAIDSIKSLKNLVNGAKLNGSEQSDFTKTIATAKQAITKASTVANVTTSHSKGVVDVTIARNALDSAIKNANLKVVANLNSDQVSAFKAIDNIKPQSILISGAIAPIIEQQDFVQAITTAKNAIINAKNTSDVTNAQKVGTTNVTAARNALDQAISAANQAKLVADLVQAQIRANNSIDSIKSLKNLVNGAKLNGSEQSDFTKTIATAKQAITKASTVANVTTSHSKGVVDVTIARNALDTAIKNANLKVVATLNNNQASAFKAIDNIKPQSTLISGAVAPIVEQQDFVQAITTAKNTIINVKTASDVTKAQKVGTTNVTAARNALDQAIGAANQAKLAADLVQAQIRANNAIDSIKSLKNLIKGAKLNGSEQSDFTKTIATAKKAINNAKTFVDVTRSHSKGVVDVTIARNVLDSAIKNANLQVVATLNNDQASAFKAIDNIKPQSTLISAAVAPIVEQQDFVQAITTAKNAIINAKTVVDVTNAQTVGTTNVTAARNALDQAIGAANQAKLAADLVQAQIRANNSIDSIKSLKNLIKGANLFGSEQNDFPKAIATAKQAIKNATTIVGVTTSHSKGVVDVTIARNALDTAIKNANLKVVANLNNDQASAFKAIDNIKPQSTLISGAVAPTIEQQDFVQAITTAKNAIMNVTTVVDVTNAQTVGTTNVTAARNALDQAIDAANQAKLAADLVQAQIRANNAIDSIKSLKNLVNGAKLNGSEQSDFTTAIATAKQAIKNATTVANVTTSHLKGVVDVTIARNALDIAIKNANLKVVANLNNDQASAFKAIDNIKPQSTLISDAIAPEIEQQGFVQAITTAKNTIMNAKKLSDVTNAQTVGTRNVTTAKDALDQAIDAANQAKLAADLVQAQIRANNAINSINSLKNLVNGANLPGFEQRDFTTAIATAKQAIKNAKTVTDVKTLHSKGVADVTIARNALDTAIKNANLKVVANLKSDQVSAFKAIDNIKPQSTLISGAITPTIEQQGFVKAITTAKNTIINAKKLSDVKNAQKVGTRNITDARNAFDVAIYKANQKNNFNIISNWSKHKLKVKGKANTLPSAVVGLIKDKLTFEKYTNLKLPILKGNTNVTIVASPNDSNGTINLSLSINTPGTTIPKSKQISTIITGFESKKHIQSPNITTKNNFGFSKVAIIGITIGSISILGIVILLLWRRKRKKSN